MNNDHADTPATPARPRPAAALLFQQPDLSAFTPPHPEPEESPRGRENAAAPAGEGGSSGGDATPSRSRSTRKRSGDNSSQKTSGRSRKNANKDKGDSANSSEGDRSGASEAPEASSKDARADKADKANSADKSDKANKAEKVDKGDKADKGNKADSKGDQPSASESGSHRRRRRRSRESSPSNPEDEITALKGSTRLEAKRQRRREGRREAHRHHAITESEFLARRESVERRMLIRERDGLNQIAVLEDGLLVEHYVARHTQTTMVGSVYLGKVQNVLPSMEAAFVDLGKRRNAVLYAGEVNWDAAGLSGHPRRIEAALKAGDNVLVQVTKDPIGHKGARLTAQITLAGRYLVLVPDGQMTGISRKLPENERRRLKKLVKAIVPSGHGVIIRTAAEGATEEQLSADVERLLGQWESIQRKQASASKAPVLLHGEPELALRVVRDVFNEDFQELVVEGKRTWQSVSAYVNEYAPDLADRCQKWVGTEDLFAANRVDEQLAKGMDRKVWLPSGGHLVIDRTEAMTVVDVNTGKYTGGASGTLEETVTKNNLEAAEELVRQLRLRDIGGIIVIDFVDMVLPSNRDLVLRRLIECLGRDRTRHQVTEVTSLGLVQMTRKRVGQGLVEAFSTPCEHCEGRGFIVHEDPVEKSSGGHSKSSKKQSSASAEEKKAKAKKQAARSMSQIAKASAEAKAGAQGVEQGEAGERADAPSAKKAAKASGGADAAAAKPAAQPVEAPSEAEQAPKRPAGRGRARADASAESLLRSDLDDLKAASASKPKRTRAAKAAKSVEIDLDAARPATVEEASEASAPEKKTRRRASAKTAASGGAEQKAPARRRRKAATSAGAAAASASSALIIESA